MAKCQFCDKGVAFGIQVSHSHRRSNRTWKPNVKRVKAIVDGSPKHVYACTRCLRSGKVTRAVYYSYYPKQARRQESIFRCGADESRTPIGFGRLLSAHAALKPLIIQTSIACGLCLACTKIISPKTAKHLSVVFFEVFSAFFGAGGLTPIKTKKAEIAERMR